MKTTYEKKYIYIYNSFFNYLNDIATYLEYFIYIYIYFLSQINILQSTNYQA